MPSTVEALRQLSYRMFNVHDIDDFDKQMMAPMNDRGACLLLLSQLESTLELAIEVTIGPWSDDAIKQLYEQDGPLATFARKIAMASALGILGPRFQKNFRLIRHMRNAFAHARKPVSFETPEIKAACLDLDLFNPTNLLGDSPSIADHSPREIFSDVVTSMLVLLQTYYRSLPPESKKTSAALP